MRVRPSDFRKLIWLILCLVPFAVALPVLSLLGISKRLIGAFVVALIIFVVIAVILGATMRYSRISRRFLLNRCLHCGYELQATRLGARCPECGRRPPSDLDPKRYA